MSGFVKLTKLDSGKPILVNVDHIADVQEMFEGVGSTLYQDFCDADGNQGYLEVAYTLDEIHAILNAAIPQLHPSMMMPPSPAPWASRASAKMDGEA